MFSVNYIFLMNNTYVFAFITCLGFLVKDIYRIILPLVNFQMLKSSIKMTFTLFIKYSMSNH